MMSGGGFLAVSLFQTRHSTRDLDYILDPAFDKVKKIHTKLAKAIATVAKDQGWPKDWLNDSMQVFTAGNAKLELFQASVSQGEVLWQSRNIIIYAIQWEWQLDHKLKRITTENQPRETDFSDAVELLHRIVKKNNGPVRRETVKSWNTNIFTPVSDGVITDIAGRYIERFDELGICEN